MIDERMSKYAELDKKLADLVAATSTAKDEDSKQADDGDKAAVETIQEE